MLRIENKMADKYLEFDELSIGDVFVYEGEVYMKTNGGAGDDNALHLVSGELNGMFGNDEVRLVNATMTIE